MESSTLRIVTTRSIVSFATVGDTAMVVPRHRRPTTVDSPTVASIGHLVEDAVESAVERQRETFAKQVHSRPDVARRLVNNGGMKKSVGKFRIHAGVTSGASRRALAGAVVLISLASCGGTSSTASETTVDGGAATGSTSAPELAQVTTSTPPAATASESTVDAVATTTPINVPELLQFTAPLVGGGEFNGADRAGLATAFWFWAPT